MLSSLFLGLSLRNFVQLLTIKALAQTWKNYHKINDVIDSDVIILRNLAKKTVKMVYFKSLLFLHLSFNPTEALQKH